MFTVNTKRLYLYPVDSNPGNGKVFKNGERVSFVPLGYEKLVESGKLTQNGDIEVKKSTNAIPDDAIERLQTIDGIGKARAEKIIEVLTAE